MSAFRNTVLVIGNYRQSLTIIRSLGRAGYQIVVSKSGTGSGAEYSRYTNDVWQHPGVKSDESVFVTALVEYLNEQEVCPIIFPVGDIEISCIARNAERLPVGTTLIMPDPDTALLCQDKYHMYNVVRDLGLPQVGYQKAVNHSELESVVSDVGLPCVIKPNDSLVPFFGKKALIINSSDQLRAAIPSWPAGHDHLLVQKFFKGDRHTCHFVAVDGEILAYFEYKILRTDRLDGTGYLVEGVSVEPTAKLREYTQALASCLEYRGVGSAQFLVDEANESVAFLEINPRLGASCALPYHCRCDLPRLAVENAEYMAGARQAPSVSSTDYTIGERLVWTFGDLQGMLRARRAGELPISTLISLVRRSFTAFLRADRHPTWWWKDPLPTCTIYGRLFGSLLRKVAKRAK